MILHEISPVLAAVQGQLWAFSDHYWHEGETRFIHIERDWKKVLFYLCRTYVALYNPSSPMASFPYSVLFLQPLRIIPAFPLGVCRVVLGEGSIWKYQYSCVAIAYPATQRLDWNPCSVTPSANMVIAAPSSASIRGAPFPESNPFRTRLLVILRLSW